MPARVAQWELAPLMDVPLRSQEHQPMNEVRIPYLLLCGLCVLHDLPPPSVSQYTLHCTP